MTEWHTFLAEAAFSYLACNLIQWNEGHFFYNWPSKNFQTTTHMIISDWMFSINKKIAYIILPSFKHPHGHFYWNKTWYNVH